MSSPISSTDIEVMSEKLAGLNLVVGQDKEIMGIMLDRVAETLSEYEDDAIEADKREKDAFHAAFTGAQMAVSMHSVDNAWIQYKAGLELAKQHQTEPEIESSTCVDCEYGLQILEVLGIPRKRARSVGNGIQVLDSRIQRETHSLLLNQRDLVNAAKALVVEMVDELVGEETEIIQTTFGEMIEVLKRFPDE